MFPVLLSISEYAAHNIGQFGANIKHFKGFNIAFDFPVSLKYTIFSVDVCV